MSDEQVDFFQPDGSTITNTISSGSSGADAGDLYMTYAFEWQHSDVDAKDTEKVEELRKKHMETAKMAVEKSIEAIRRYVQMERRVGGLRWLRRWLIFGL